MNINQQKIEDKHAIQKKKESKNGHVKEVWPRAQIRAPHTITPNSNIKYSRGVKYLQDLMKE